MDSSEQIKERLVLAQQKYERAKEKAARLAKTTVVEDLEGDLGAVVVSGYGQLNEIRINPAELRYTNGRGLSAALLRSIKRAEAKAEALRQETSTDAREGHRR
ncbi:MULTISPECIES: YbaB/EbfC family nucleoid-associated protein [Actinoalloteichus]|uniref:Uncharacterized protein n=1 Tax=Actinoalloteichus fjordicus TaxID=1612552 RepID=A0AAC9LFA7_9PSEU|nr:MULTISPECIES: YbaB/EbfC family nucleoid-associated protein [Actinoalloteichus]APU16798.1 hypothetical protein UA74_23900 [Actinoalloteichus fjordicus]APU22863.1 hypothetical protein UA75_24405 [Actinoalloteichus sp. GBA129-24]